MNNQILTIAGLLSTKPKDFDPATYKGINYNTRKQKAAKKRP